MPTSVAKSSQRLTDSAPPAPRRSRVPSKNPGDHSDEIAEDQPRFGEFVIFFHRGHGSVTILILKSILALDIRIHLARGCHHIVVQVVHDPDGTDDHDEDDADRGDEARQASSAARFSFARCIKKISWTNSWAMARRMIAGNNCAISHMEKCWIHHDKERGEREHDRKRQIR